jgi:hypothetical protein
VALADLVALAVSEEAVPVVVVQEEVFNDISQILIVHSVERRHRRILGLSLQLAALQS